MTVDIIKNENEAVILVAGRIDTATAPDFENAVNAVLQAFDNVIFDFKDLDYISSAGLRVMLRSQKSINAKFGTLKVINANETVAEIFEVTGFSSIIDIE